VLFRGLALVLSKATPVGNFPKDNLLFDLGSGNAWRAHECVGHACRWLAGM
jgi:hypothetical protein